MSIDDAEPGDIYADSNGKLWRILSVYREPTVEAEEVEGILNDPNTPRVNVLAAAAQGMVVQSFSPLRASIDKRKQKAFTGSNVWLGWQRIFRRKQAIADTQQEVLPSGAGGGGTVI